MADCRIDAATAALAELHPHPALELRAVQADVNDCRALFSLLDDADLVINTVGPYYQYGTTVMDVAIDSGTHYLDICDDPEPTFMMLRRNALARERGVRAVIGMGASPGITSMLARLAWEQLDSVEEVDTHWSVEDDSMPISSSPTSVDAALVHWVQ